MKKFYNLWARFSVVRLTEEPELLASILGPAHTFVEIDHEIFSRVISHLLLVQEGQFSITGESMCTRYWLTPYEI